MAFVVALVREPVENTDYSEGVRLALGFVDQSTLIYGTGILHA
jgi:hypothetical protein